MSDAHSVADRSHPVLSPMRIGSVRLRNRAAVAPMSRVSTRGDGIATSRMRDYYARFADGGFGLIITEGVYPDAGRSQAYWNQPGIATEEQAGAWRPVAEGVHEAGGRVFMQLMHAGALVQENPRHACGLAPSAVSPKGAKMPAYGGRGPYPTPQAMTEADLVDVRDGFAEAAARAAGAGFDGAEIHSANGYLLDQFLTTYTNERTDRYGGAPEARVRFVAEVTAAAVEATPTDFVVGVRLSQTKVNDFTYRWPGDTEEAAVYFRALSEAGADYLHLASEGRDWAETATLKTGGSEPDVTAGHLAREVTSRPVFVNGGMHEPAQAAEVLSGGHGDVVSLGRGALANPDWPQRLAAGQAIEAFDPAILEPTAALAGVAEQER